MTNNKIYDNIYNAIITLVICLLGASFGYGQINLKISYPDMLAIIFIISTVFILLKISGHKLLYLSVPVLCLTVIFYFSGIKTFPSYAARFFKWFISYGAIEDELSRSFSLVYAILLCTLLCSAALLLVRFYRLQLITGFLLLAAYITLLLKDIFLFKRSVIFVLIYFVIVLIEFAHMRGQNKAFENAKKKVVNLFPSIAIIFFILLAIPVKEEPININIAGALEYCFNKFSNLTGFGQTKYNMAFTGYSNSAFLKDSIIQKNKTVMTIDVEGSTLTNIYLIGNVYDTFDGREWTSTSNEESDYNLDYYETIYALARYNPEDYSDIIQLSSLNITFNNFITDSVFYPLKTRYLHTDGYTVLSSGGNLVFSTNQKDKTNYDLTYYQINLDNPYTYRFIRNQMGYHYTKNRELSPDAAETIFKKYKNGNMDLTSLETMLYDHSKYVNETYTNLPELSEPVIEYIEAITSGYNNDIDKLKAIEYTLSRYTYTTKPSITPSDKDFLERFLLESKEGYCTYYATAFTLMARYLGYPARYVQGFCVPAISNNTIEVSSRNAHAWSEVYFEGVGWIPFEPTPSYAESRYTPWAVSANETLQNSVNQNFENQSPESQNFTQGENTEPSKENTVSEESMPAANSGEHYNIDTDEIAPLPTYTPNVDSKYKPIITAVLVIISVIMIFTALFTLLYILIKIADKKYNALSRRQKVIHNMSKILLLLKKYGFSLRTNETLSEFYVRINPECSEYAPFLNEAIPLFEQIRYGNSDIDDRAVKLYEDWLKQLLKNCKLKFSKPVYIILWLKIKLK